MEFPAQRELNGGRRLFRRKKYRVRGRCQPDVVKNESGRSKNCLICIEKVRRITRVPVGGAPTKDKYFLRLGLWFFKIQIKREFFLQKWIFLNNLSRRPEF